MRLTAMQNQQESKQVLAHSDNSNLVEVRAEQFSGPLPHPELLEHYNRIIPNAAEHIFTEFEQQAKHRIEMEKAVVASAVWKEKWGISFWFCICNDSYYSWSCDSPYGCTTVGRKFVFCRISSYSYCSSGYSF